MNVGIIKDLQQIDFLFKPLSSIKICSTTLTNAKKRSFGSFLRPDNCTNHMHDSRSYHLRQYVKQGD